MNGAATGSVVQQLETTMPFDCNAGSFEAISARSAAVVTIAFAPWRTAVSYAACTLVGVPSVVTTLVDQPRALAACATIWPWIWQTETPQLMNATFLPLGTALPTGFDTVIAPGRCIACETTC